MKVLVWQWGRYGSGPRTGVDWAASLAALPGVTSALSLSAQAELLHAAPKPHVDLLVRTYDNFAGFGLRVLSLPWFLPWLTTHVRRLAPDVALCAMPGPLDLTMAAALRHLGIPMAVAVHDADPHPGDGFPLQMHMQRLLVNRADALVAMSDFVAQRLRQQGIVHNRPLLRTALPQAPIPGLPPVRQHDGPFRLLSFGRLLAYKGLDLLHEALAQLLPGTDIVVRVVGRGPEGPELAALRQLPGVTVENRWVPEEEIPDLLAWADGVVLSHREASQSGVAASALAAGRYLVATKVGGLVEQAAGNPAALLCDVSADSIAQALRVMLTLPPPGPVSGFGLQTTESLAAGLRGLIAVKGSNASRSTQASSTLSA
jgi:glycosyltransferase involved in cell wall biosynthesis